MHYLHSLYEGVLLKIPLRSVVEADKSKVLVVSSGDFVLLSLVFVGDTEIVETGLDVEVEIILDFDVTIDLVSLEVVVAVEDVEDSGVDRVVVSVVVETGSILVGVDVVGDLFWVLGNLVVVVLCDVVGVEDVAIEVVSVANFLVELIGVLEVGEGVPELVENVTVVDRLLEVTAGDSLDVVLSVFIGGNVLLVLIEASVLLVLISSVLEGLTYTVLEIVGCVVEDINGVD